MKELAIGVFDSGMGGLTVLKSLRQALPQEHFIYLGDMARLPYGTKSQETVQHYAAQMTRVLLAQEIKALVIACNTATTAALTHLQTLYPELLIMGVVEPGAMAAVEGPDSERILVLATETTIASKAYHHAIAAKRPDAIVEGRACSLLVALAEEGLLDHPVTELTLKHYLDNLSNIDTILLGCTHFPVFRPILTRMLPELHIVDSALATAKVLSQELAQANLLRTNGPGHTRYLVTDAAERFTRIGQLFLGECLNPNKVTLIDA